MKNHLQKYWLLYVVAILVIIYLFRDKMPTVGFSTQRTPDSTLYPERKKCYLNNEFVGYADENGVCENQVSINI